METQKRRTWAEVSLENLSHNYRVLREELSSQCKFMGMVKSDAYGHGAVPISRALERLGADYLGVACLDEALELRQGGITSPILVLGATLPEDTGLLLKHQIAQTVFDVETAQAFSKEAQAAGAELTIHIKVDTGMSRLGIFANESLMEKAIETVVRLYDLPGLVAEGIFTHFADSDGDEAYTMEQLTLFLTVLDKLKERGISFAIRHAANSAATLLYPATHLDMVRPGLALYGHYPKAELGEMYDLYPVMEVKSRIASVKTVPEAATVSYGRTYTLPSERRLAVIPIGYGDGFSRGFSNQFTVTIHGKRAAILGMVCMDMCIVDVSDIPNATAGEEAIIYSREANSGQTIEDGAKLLHTIPYEMLCALSKRIPRIYEGDAGETKNVFRHRLI